MPENEKHTDATWWALVLSDWKRSDAFVTVHLRGGVTLGPGKITRIPSAAAGESAQLHDPHRITLDGRHWETKWDFDLSQVAAITAEARR